MENGKPAKKPADPKEAGWVFGGWYTDAACTVAYDFSTPVTKAFTLYAKWTKEEEKKDDFCFDDVKNKKAFYFDAVYWAYNAEPQITNGMDKTHFGPDAGCTRGQIVTFLYRAMEGK